MGSQTIPEERNSSILIQQQSPTTISQPDISQITIKEFLNFLKTAYQVKESIEGLLQAEGMTEALTWLKKKENQFLLSQNSTTCQTSDTLIAVSSKPSVSVNKKRSSCDSIKSKLSEVLSEGILDSVLPYLIQTQSSTVLKKGHSVGKLTVENKSQTVLSGSEKNLRRKSIDVINKTDSEVEIHVCDEVKNLKRTFVCNQKLLVEKMGYFAEVTVGQKLEDMDISVHCDIGIFEWLMQWVKKDSLLQEDWPQLDPQCVVPVLVSAAFLQMEPLQQDCLFFCHQRLNEILRTTTNLSCLNDSVLTRLAAMYTNSELELIRDRKDKIISRLYCKMIVSLIEPEPESVRGHWNSLARCFRCVKCQQLVDPIVALEIPCIPSCMRLQTDGSIINIHIRDPSWNVNDYILQLHKSLKTWRKVYWRLWGDAHYLYCTVCKRYFPSNQIGWCRFHPDTPQFFTVDAQRAPLPIGRYPCCGERAYRFQIIDNNTGCQFRQHTIESDDVRDTQVLTMLETFRNLIEEEPPQLLIPEKLTRLVAKETTSNDQKFVCKEQFWWDGFEIVPPRPKMGLLSLFSNRGSAKCDYNLAPPVSPVVPPPPVDDSSEGDSDNESSTTSVNSSNSDDGSGESDPIPTKVNFSKKRVIVKRKSKMGAKKKRTKAKNSTRLWQQKLSARNNQDNQRGFEENLVKEMAFFLNKKMIMSEALVRSKISRYNPPPGGVWMRLEGEWKDGLHHNGATQQKQKSFIITKQKQRGKFS